MNLWLDLVDTHDSNQFTNNLKILCTQFCSLACVYTIQYRVGYEVTVDSVVYMILFSWLCGGWVGGAWDLLPSHCLFKIVEYFNAESLNQEIVLNFYWLLNLSLTLRKLFLNFFYWLLAMRYFNLNLKHIFPENM